MNLSNFCTFSFNKPEDCGGCFGSLPYDKEYLQHFVLGPIMIVVYNYGIKECVQCIQSFSCILNAMSSLLVFFCHSLTNHHFSCLKAPWSARVHQTGSLITVAHLSPVRTVNLICKKTEESFLLNKDVYPTTVLLSLCVKGIYIKGKLQ